MLMTESVGLEAFGQNAEADSWLLCVSCKHQLLAITYAPTDNMQSDWYGF